MRRLAVVLSIVFLAAACSGDDDDNDSAAATKPSTTTATSTAPVDSTSPSTASPPADLEAASLTLAEVASALDSPVALAWRAGDDRMYVAEQSGAVRIVEDGAPLERPVLEVDVATGGNEQGLLGLTFSADGTKLYVDYTDPDGDTRVDEYTMNGDVADTGARRELLAVDQPFANHNGGEVIFGPDGMLYITLGDGGSAGDPQQRAQNLDELLGKILRIDPAPVEGAEYTIPPDNPFVGRSGARPEIWMWGLRNPWRFSFDRETNDIWIADVGQNAWEEVDYAPAGSSGINWGWDRREGTHEFDGDRPEGARDPIFELSHDDGNCSITGGYVYRGAAIPALRGTYVFADFCNGRLLGITQANGALAQQREFDVPVDAPTSFGQDPNGELYVVSRAGTIYRIDPA